jgi:excisionase family DNA binding protein
MPDESELYPAQLLLTVDQVAQRLNISRSMVYRLIQHSSLKVVHLGRAVRISSKSLQQWLQEQEQQQ